MRKFIFIILLILLIFVSCGKNDKYYEECGSKVFSNSTDIYYPNEEVYYLGEYNNYHFVVIHNYHNNYQYGFHAEENYKNIVKIQGIEFIYYCDSYHIFGYKTGKESTMLELKDAYEKGIINIDDLNQIKIKIDMIDFSMYNNNK